MLALPNDRVPFIEDPTPFKAEELLAPRACPDELDRRLLCIGEVFIPFPFVCPVALLFCAIERDRGRFWTLPMICAASGSL